MDQEKGLIEMEIKLLIEKVIVLTFSMAQLAVRLHLNIQDTSQAPSLIKRLLHTCSYPRCNYQARRFTVS
jgi:hypothetical protein